MLPLIDPSFRTAPNCHFMIDDAESDWVFTEREAFDYVHARYLYPGISDWSRLWQQSLENMRPGGWAESQEISAWFYSDEPGFEASNIQYWQEQIDEATTKMGKRFNIAHEQKQRMLDAGFINVTQEVVEVRTTTTLDKVTRNAKARLDVLLGSRYPSARGTGSTWRSANAPCSTSSKAWPPPRWPSSAASWTGTCPPSRRCWPPSGTSFCITGGRPTSSSILPTAKSPLQIRILSLKRTCWLLRDEKSG